MATGNVSHPLVSNLCRVARVIRYHTTRQGGGGGGVLISVGGGGTLLVARTDRLATGEVSGPLLGT